MLKDSIRSVFKYFILLTLSPLRWLIYFLSGLVPRSNKIWVFGSWDGYRFSDNSKWFYIHCRDNNYPEKFIWITRKKKLADFLKEHGYKAFYFLSLKGLWYSLRAKFYLIDHTSQDINFFTSRNAIVINQFHGVPLKKIRRDIRQKNNFNSKVYRGKWYEKTMLFITRPYLYEKINYFSVTSSKNKKIFSSAFNLPLENLHVNGYPRNDIFLNLKQTLPPVDNDIFEKLKEEKSRFKKIILYLPTWRDHDRERSDPFHWRKLNSFLQKNESLFIPKLHSYEKQSVNYAKDLSNILFLDHTVDIYPLIRITDILVTDYSSIYFDFLLTKKPIVFYCYDLHDYMSKSRAFYYDYNEVTPGDKARNLDQLMSSLEQAINDEEVYLSNWKNKYEEVLDFSYTYQDGNSAKRLYNDITEQYQLH